MNTKN
jgi:hypothetical protein